MVPEFSFAVIETGVESSCFLCPTLIVPGVDYWTTVTSVASKKETWSAHQECFELFAWAATNFIFQTAKEETVAQLN